MGTTRVLVVDDNPVNLELAVFVLSCGGNLVESASDARQGIAKAKSLQPDVILLDLEMPDLDGLTTLKALKTDPETAHIPVIALTGNAMVGCREKCLSAGFSEYLTKPFSRQEITEMVARVVGVPTGRP